MQKRIETIGHVDHGKTTLSAAIINATLLSLLDNAQSETKTIHEIIEQEKSIPYHAPAYLEPTPLDFKSGKQSRRERRAKERKAKKK